MEDVIIVVHETPHSMRSVTSRFGADLTYFRFLDPMRESGVVTTTKYEISTVMKVNQHWMTLALSSMAFLFLYQIDMERGRLPCSQDPEMKNRVFDCVEEHIEKKFNCSLVWRHDRLAIDSTEPNRQAIFHNTLSEKRIENDETQS